jgi:hypothetical protein
MQHSEAYEKFIASTRITMEDWREGNGYDLEAVKEVEGRERDELADVLAEQLKANPDWRPVEALAAIGSRRAILILRDALKRAGPELKMHVIEKLAELGEPADMESAIVEALRNTSTGSGLSYAIDSAERHPSPRIQETLLDLALNGNDDQRMHCAALALYLGGKAESAFDWNHRTFFLRFDDADRNVRIEAYKELCERLGAAPKVK